MNFFFKYYMKRKTKKKVTSIRDKGNEFLRKNDVKDSAIIDAINYMDYGLLCRNDDFLYKQGIFRSGVFKTPKHLVPHDILSHSKYSEWHFKKIGDNTSITELDFKRKMSAEICFASELIANHHAVEHYAEGIIGMRECEDVEGMILFCAVNRGMTAKNYDKALEQALDTVTMFYRAVNYSHGSPIRDDLIGTYVRNIYDDAKNNNKDVFIKRFNKLIGYMFVGEEIVEKLSNATILGADILNEMGLVNKLFLIRYLNEVVRIPKHRRCPIKYIDLRNLWPYVDTKDISSAVNNTLGKNIISKSERHIEYVVTNGVLSLEIF